MIITLDEIYFKGIKVTAGFRFLKCPMSLYIYIYISMYVYIFLYIYVYIFFCDANVYLFPLFIPPIYPPIYSPYLSAQIRGFFYIPQHL